jgi:hypothetical protein
LESTTFLGRAFSLIYDRKHSYRTIWQKPFHSLPLMSHFHPLITDCFSSESVLFEPCHNVMTTSEDSRPRPSPDETAVLQPAVLLDYHLPKRSMERKQLITTTMAALLDPAVWTDWAIRIWFTNHKPQNQNRRFLKSIL